MSKIFLFFLNPIPNDLIYKNAKDSKTVVKQIGISVIMYKSKVIFHTPILSSLKQLASPLFCLEESQ